MIFTDPGWLFIWQYFYYRSLISSSSYKSSQLFDRVQGGSLMQFRAQLSQHYVLERHFVHSRQRNEILCITEHSAEATASPWLLCNGLWRVIRRGPGHRAGIKCCPLPLAAHGVYENHLGPEQAGQNSSDGKCISFLKALGSRRPGRSSRVIENPTVNHVYLQYPRKSSITSCGGNAAVLVPCFSLSSLITSSCRPLSSHPAWPTWGASSAGLHCSSPGGCPGLPALTATPSWKPGADRLLSPCFLLPSLSI